MRLDAVPMRQRGDEFKADDKRLARLLNLGGEWFCSVCSVTNRGLINPEWMSPHVYADKVKVRAVREQLLQASKEKASEDPRQSLGAGAG
jgi:hypothetical protein